MKTMKFGYYCFLLNLVFSTTSVSGVFYSFKSDKNECFNVTSAISTSVATTEDCLLHCLNTTSCALVAVDDGNHGVYQCHVITQEELDWTTVVPCIGWTIMRKQSGVSGLCQDGACINGGVCLQRQDHFLCACAEGFSEAFCSLNYDDCVNASCENGATCQDGINDYTCICVSGYIGSYCEVNIDDCVGVTCLNGGTCMDGVNEYTCLCAPGYMGTICDVECLMTPDGSGYVGTTSVTETGLTCQRWDQTSPHSHFYRLTQGLFPDPPLSNMQNYCRRPDSDRPWCYTTNPDVRWEYCNIPLCSA